MVTLNTQHNINHFSYPFKGKAKAEWNLPFHFQLGNHIKSILPRNYQRKRNPIIEVWLANNKPFKPLLSDDMPAIFLVHNDLKMMRSFLLHYRKIGVTRFICVDDQSTDGTTEYLLSQEDVDVYHSNVRYSTAHRGKAWREMLAAIYGKNRWYLNLDSDEYLLTGLEDDISILEYANSLEKQGILRLPAPMLDLMPFDRLEEAHFTGDDDRMPWEVATHYDADGYHGYILSSCIGMRGGARTRVFDAIVDLMKYPLLYWDNKTSMGASIHAPKPGFRNFAPVCGCLMHFKIFSDIHEISKNAVNDDQYYLGAREYKRLHSFFEQGAVPKLNYEGSLKYSGSQKLIDEGFIVPVKG